MRDTVNDLETRINKRTKKHTYKMDVTYHPQVKYESKNEELAAKLGQPDPVLTRHFKRSHAFTYQEHMGLEADRALFRAGCLPQNIYEGDGTNVQKLEDYNDLLWNRQKRQKVNDVSDQTNLFVQKDDFISPPFETFNGEVQGISSDERLNILSNLRFFKDEPVQRDDKVLRKISKQYNNANKLAYAHLDESMRPTGLTRYEAN